MFVQGHIHIHLSTSKLIVEILVLSYFAAWGKK